MSNILQPCMNITHTNNKHVCVYNYIYIISVYVFLMLLNLNIFQHMRLDDSERFKPRESLIYCKMEEKNISSRHAHHISQGHRW